jgi:hypothetical protein
MISDVKMTAEGGPIPSRDVNHEVSTQNADLPEPNCVVEQADPMVYIIEGGPSQYAPPIALVTLADASLDPLQIT